MPRDPRARRAPLIRRPSAGHTRRPLGTAGAGEANALADQWAQARFFGYPDSQLTPLDRPRRPDTVPSGSGAPIESLLNDAGVGCKRSQYTVSIAGAELGLDAPFVGDPIPTRQDVQRLGRLPSALQLRIEWSLGAGRDNRMDLDVGAGFQLTLPAVRIQMSLLLPAGAIDLDQRAGQVIPTPPVDPVTGQPPTVWNAALLWGTVNRTESFSSIPEWQLTRTLFVPAGTVQTVPIPETADFVEAFQTSGVGAPAGFFNFLTGSLLDVGQWSGNTANPRNWRRVRIPGQARFIGSGPANQAQDRLFTYIFTIRP